VRYEEKENLKTGLKNVIKNILIKRLNWAYRQMILTKLKYRVKWENKKDISSPWGRTKEPACLTREKRPACRG